MAILSSSVDKSAAEFRANAEKMRALTAELQARRAEAALGGSEKSRERHVGARQAAAARPGDEPDRSRLAVPGTVAARRQRHV